MFLKCLIKFTSEALWALRFLIERVLITKNLFTRYRFIWIFQCLSCVRLGNFYPSRNWPVSFFYLSNVLDKFVSSILLLAQIGSVVVPLPFIPDIGNLCLPLTFFSLNQSSWRWINFIHLFKELSVDFSNFFYCFFYFIPLYSLFFPSLYLF